MLGFYIIGKIFNCAVIVGLVYLIGKNIRRLLDQDIELRIKLHELDLQIKRLQMEIRNGK